MGIIASDKGGFELPPVGVFAAVCVQVIDLGTQRNEFEGKVTTNRQVRIGWELNGVDRLGGPGKALMADGQPFLVTEIYTVSLNENSKLRPILESWRGRPFTDDELDGFDIANLLGKPCLLDIEHKAKKSGGTKSFVKSAKRWPSGDPAPKTVNPHLLFDLSNFDDKLYAGLTEWLQTKIAASPEYAAAVRGVLNPAGAASPAAGEPPFNDDIPF